MIVNGIELDGLSIDELKALKRRWYQDAQIDGSLDAIHRVARSLGRQISAGPGPKYRWVEGDVHVYVDNYGNYMTVHVGGANIYTGGRKVCSTHPTEQVFVPGPWMDTIRRCDPEAQTQEALMEGSQIASERGRLLVSSEESEPPGGADGPWHQEG